MASWLAQERGWLLEWIVACLKYQLTLGSYKALLLAVARSSYSFARLSRFAVSTAPRCSWMPGACSELGSVGGQLLLGLALPGSEVDLT